MIDPMENRDAVSAADRDELILLVRDIDAEGRHPELHLSGSEAARIADAVIAANWRKTSGQAHRD